jgi:hypothetical protein
MGVFVPDWRVCRAGTRTRVALWLFTEVGEGGTFTKAQLRGAFPGVEQVDRRMRDLRAEGWQISTYREDRSLAADELRLVTVGGRVWEPGYRTRQAAVSDGDRARTLEADGYACRACGISAGEPYPDDRLRTAQLSVERVARQSGAPYLRALCERCMVGRARQNAPAEAEAMAAAVTRLPDSDLQEFAGWASSGQRDRSSAEALWSRYCALPHNARGEIACQAAAELQHRREAAHSARRASHGQVAGPQ